MKVRILFILQILGTSYMINDQFFKFVIILTK